MKTKDYEQKKKDLKKIKKEGMKNGDFQDTKSRKRFVEGIRTSFRSLKRSEKQTIKQKIEEEINIEEDLRIYDEPELFDEI